MYRLTLISFFLVVLSSPLAQAGENQAGDATISPDYTSWWVPWEDTRPRDPDVGPDGRIWFVGQADDYVAVFNPADSTFRRFDLPEGSGPHNLIVNDATGIIWYAGNRAAYIGRLDPATGEITRYPMPNPKARDPHTLRFDGKGNIWFTVQGGNFLGRLAMQSGDIELWPVPTPNALPYGLVVDDNGKPWVAELGTNKLGTVNLDNGKYVEINLPRKDARPRRIAMTADGRVWYVDYAGGYLGVYDPASGKFLEYLSPAGEDARPYGMEVDAQGRIWYAETGPQPNHLIGFDPATEEFFSSSEIPHAKGAVRNMVFHEGVLWFGTDTNYLVRTELPE